MVGSIICGVDESASARGAAQVARGLSGKLGLGLVFVRVVDEGLPDEKINAIAERLERLTAAAGEVDAGARWLVEVGHPADRLVAAAADTGASMIVVGSHGPRSSLLGSVSAEISKRAPCPVVVVPPGTENRLSDDRSLPDDGRMSAPVSQSRRRRHLSLRPRVPAGRRLDLHTVEEETTSAWARWAQQRADVAALPAPEAVVSRRVDAVGMGRRVSGLRERVGGSATR